MHVGIEPKVADLLTFLLTYGQTDSDGVLDVLMYPHDTDNSTNHAHILFPYRTFCRSAILLKQRCCNLLIYILPNTSFSTEYNLRK